MALIARLAWRNLWRQPRRTWLTTAAMVFSNVLLIFLMSLQVGMYGMMIDNSLQLFSGHLQVQAPGYLDDNKMRQTVPGVEQLSRHLRDELQDARVAARGVAFALASSADRSYGIQVYGVEPQFEPTVSSLPGLVRTGRFLQHTHAAEIVIGATLARNLRIAIGDELTLLGSALDGSVAANVLTVVGTFESGVNDIDRHIAEIPLGTFQDTFYMDGAGHQVVVAGNDYAQVDELQARVSALLPSGHALAVPVWDQLQPGLKQAIQADLGSSFFLYFVLVVLVAFSVLNTQLMSVLERTREFGISLALGVTPGVLGRLVMLETAMMGVLGIVLGALAGALLTTWFSVRGLTWPGMEEMAAQFNLPATMHPQISMLSLLAGPLVVFLFTLFASLYPALRLRWLQPVAAMRVA